MSTPRRSLLAVAAALVVVTVAGIAVVRVRHHDPRSCAAEPFVPGARVPAVFHRGPDAADGDRRLARLVSTARSWGLGSVVGSLGFDYGQVLSVAALPDGLAAWTKDSADLALLDPSLRARWGIEQVKGQHAWDLTDDTWYQARLPAHTPMEVTARRLSDGAQRWCVRVGTVPTRFGEPLATLPVAGGDLLVLGAAGAGSRVTRLSGSDGGLRWSRTLSTGADGAALVGFGRLVVAGGRAAYDLTGGAPDRLQALDPGTGRTRWTWSGRGPVHVLGSAARRLVVEQQVGHRLVLTALDPHGRVAWRRRAPVGALPDAALRDGTAVLRTPTALLGWSASTGTPQWRRRVPATPQPYPYGFQLDAQPMLDARHLLLAGTTALLSVDLGTGRLHRYPLPVHGIDTTYWPYQLAVSPQLVAVVTNTGAVVLRR